MKHFFVTKFFVLLCALVSVQFAFSQRFSTIDSLINTSVTNKDIPGAVFCVVKDSQIVYLQAYGNKEVYPKTKKMTTSTIFDLASLSKPTGAGMAITLLLQQNRIALTDPVAKFIPGFNEKTTVAHLLTHSSGLPAYANVARLKAQYGAPERDSLIAHIAGLSQNHSLPYFTQVTTNGDTVEAAEFRYSCLNFITLQRIVEVVSGQTLKDFCAENIFAPLHMEHTAYCPPASWQKNIAPTEYLKDEKRLLLGEVHDPLARVMNAGISGNAGVFSTAEDLAKLATFFLTIDSATESPFPTYDSLSQKNTPANAVIDNLSAFREMPKCLLGGRSLGWDVCSDYAGCKGSLLSPEAFCHTGYTGTEMIIDPIRHIAIILLTNRAHPYDKGAVGGLRRQVADNMAILYPLPLSASVTALEISSIPAISK